MDLGTVMLMLAVGSFLFGLLLSIFKFNNNRPEEIPYWIAAKILQAVGSLLLYYEADSVALLTILADILILAGCAYEIWAVRILMGHSVNPGSHISTAVAIILASLVSIFMEYPFRNGYIFLLQSILYFLPGLFLLGKSYGKFSLRLILGISYFSTGAVFLTSSVVCLFFPENALSLRKSAVFNIIPIASFCIFLISGFIMLMLAKEKSDMLVQEMQKNLKKSEIRFQNIVETAIEGILIFDENYNITFANKNMASMLGYTVEEMIGRTYVSFIPESHTDVYNYQVSLSKKGEDSVYECCLMKKDGEKNWFLISAKAIFDDYGNFEGSFSVLTNINERKKRRCSWKKKIAN